MSRDKDDSRVDFVPFLGRKARPEHADVMAIDAFAMFLGSIPGRPRRADVFHKMLNRLWYHVSPARPLARHEIKAAVASFAGYVEGIEAGKLELARPHHAALELLGVAVEFHQPTVDPGPLGRIPSPFAGGRKPHMRNSASEVRDDQVQREATHGPMSQVTQKGMAPDRWPAIRGHQKLSHTPKAPR